MDRPSTSCLNLTVFQKGGKAVFVCKTWQETERTHNSAFVENFFLQRGL